MIHGYITHAHELSESARPEIAALLVETLEAFVGLFERRARDRAFALGVVRGVFATTRARADDVIDEAAATSWFFRSLRRGVGERSHPADPRWRAVEAALHELDESTPPRATPPSPSVLACGPATQARHALTRRR